MASKTNTPDMQEMFTAFAAFMASQTADKATTEDAAVEHPPAKKRSTAKRSTAAATPKRTTANRTATATTKPTRVTPKGVITCGEAWKLLGADPTFQPSNPSAPARNAQLWALNAKGLLKIAS